MILQKIVIKMVCLRKMWYFSCWHKVRWKVERLFEMFCIKCGSRQEKPFPFAALWILRFHDISPLKVCLAASPRRRRPAAWCPAPRWAAPGRRSSPPGPPPRTPPSRSRPLSRVTCHVSQLNTRSSGTRSELLHRTCWKCLLLSLRNSKKLVKNILLCVKSVPLPYVFFLEKTIQ